MKITNVKIFCQNSFQEGGVEFEEKFTRIGPAVTPEGSLDGGGCYLIPGLVDIHTHGAMGEDVSDGRGEGLPILSRYYAAKGVTTWLPTTMTLGEETLTTAMHMLRDFRRPQDGAKLGGIHLEGPFLSRAKLGAQNGDYLHAPAVELFHRLNDASGGLVKLVTVAPEEPGAMALIQEASQIATVSLGHTGADYATALAAFQAGASHATHLYNGMPALHHREPGVIGAALDAGAWVELIVDGFHIHPSVVRLTHRLFGERFCLISDSARCAGMPDGEYELGGLPIVLKGNKATLAGSDTIAGSSIHLMDGLKKAVSFGLSLEEAVFAATCAPARSVGLDQEIGSIQVGKWADFVLLDGSLNVKDVYLNGSSIHGERRG